MTRAFLLVTAVVAAGLGWVVTVALQFVTGSSVALVCGTAAACLFVGGVVGTLRSE